MHKGERERERERERALLISAWKQNSIFCRQVFTWSTGDMGQVARMINVREHTVSVRMF